MKLQYLIFLSALSLFLLTCAERPNKQANSDKSVSKRPNILLLLADDMGYGELGSYGQSVIQTPFLDELAANGLRFTDFYAGTAVCSPSRAVLMTGQHAGHTSIRGNNGLLEGKWQRLPLKKSEVTIGEMLKQAGYETAMVGKWHLDDPDDLSTWACKRGFDYAVQEQWAARGGKGYPFDERVHWINERQDSILYNYQDYSCLDEFRTNFAIDFLDNKDDSKPFFLYMSYRIPHAHEYYVRDNELYKDKGFPEVERTFAARITMLDQQVKRLYEELERRGELDNTLIIFTSDNGPHHQVKHKVFTERHDRLFFKSSGGLRGFKRDLYEGGIRVPCIAYWKNKIRSGKTTDHSAVFYDFMPTFAELAQTTIPSQADGISFLPELLGKEQSKHEFMYWEIHNNPKVKGFRQAVRQGKWKAVRYGDRYKTELYNLDKDPFEEEDVSKQHPETINKINAILKRESSSTSRYEFAGGVFK